MHSDYSLEVPMSQSRPVVICDHQPRWQNEFVEQAQLLRKVVGNDALRIDHIGSTAVPGLAAKDIIDVQLTVASLDNCERLAAAMQDAKYRKRGNVRYDELVGNPEQALPKLYFREPLEQRRVHIHVRQQDSINQRYPLLFRDYLRANKTTREAYQLIKQRLAVMFPDCIEGYLFIKDPMMDIIYQGAEEWARHTGWSPDNEFY